MAEGGWAQDCRGTPDHPASISPAQGCGGPTGCMAEEECGEQGWVTP
jgi:hypothetical protein